MMKTISSSLLFRRSCMLLAAMLLLGAPLLYAADVIVTGFQGQVEVLRKNGKNWEKVRSGLVLRVGDKVRTGKASQATTISQEGHRITIKEGTVLQISQLGPREWEFNQEVGRARLKIAKLKSNQSLRVRTPTAVCAVRGTEFEVAVLEDRSTLLDVFEGMVGFANPEAAAPEIMVLENQTSSVQPGAAPKPPEPMQPAEGQAPGQEGQKQPAQQQPGQPGQPGQQGMQPGTTPKEFERMKAEGMSPEQMQKMREAFTPEQMKEMKDAKDMSPEERKEMWDRMTPEQQQLISEMREMRETRGEEGFKRDFGSETGFGSRMDARESFRQEIVREVAMDLVRDEHETATTFEQQASQYQEAKTLIDAFGQRVRLEEYITRPTPESFKFVALNTRADRFDYAFFEVVANKPLPERLETAGNLWNSIGPVQPEYYAVKERWFATNQGDTYSELKLDGESRMINFQKPVFDDNGMFLGDTNEVGYQTVFDHQYLFLNGNPAAIERAWVDRSFRPLDNGALAGMNVTGMMYHMRPVLVEMYDPFFTAGPRGSFWRDVFVTGAGTSGKMEVVMHEPDADPYKAHFKEKHGFVNFIDTNGNGRLDQGERYNDFNRNGVRDINEPFEDVVQLGLNGTKDLSRTHTAVGDTTFFSDLNRDGLNNDGMTGTSPFQVAQRPWAWMEVDSFLIDNSGNILDFRDAGFGGLTQGAEDQNALADAFEKVNFERVMRSSEFGERKIDIVVTPRILFKSGDLNPRFRGSDTIDGR